MTSHSWQWYSILPCSSSVTVIPVYAKQCTSCEQVPNSHWSFWRDRKEAGKQICQVYLTKMHLCDWSKVKGILSRTCLWLTRSIVNTYYYLGLCTRMLSLRTKFLFSLRASLFLLQPLISGFCGGFFFFFGVLPKDTTLSFNPNFIFVLPP